LRGAGALDDIIDVLILLLPTVAQRRVQ